MQFIDIHTHCCLGKRDMTPERMEVLAKRAGIRRVNLLGDFVIGSTAEQMVRCNSDTIARVQAQPDFFSGFCYLNPMLDRTLLLEEIDRCVEAGLIGLKFEVELNCRSDRLDPLMAAAEARGLPVLHHSWYQPGFEARPTLDESTPADLADLARRFPKVTIVMAHLAGVGHRGVLDVAACSNVLVDTSGGPPVAGLVAFAVDVLGAERVIYGSDFPIRNFASQLGRVFGAELTAEQRRLILHDNAVRVLGGALC